MKGRAAVFTRVGQPLEIREYPLPALEPEAQLVKIGMANICGSDLHFMKGLGPGIREGLPQILGHEMMGRVVDQGKGATEDTQGEPLRPGDRIVYAYFKGCGRCPACLHGAPGCPHRYRHWLGVSCEESPHFRGAYGEYYYLQPGQWVFRVPDELPDALVSPVNCALAEVIYGLHRIGVVLGDSVVIQGAGGLGLYATAVAREMGAGTIIVVDKIAARLELAMAFGADHVIQADATGAAGRVQQVRDLTRGGADVVAELAGTPAVLPEGAEMLRYGGRYLWIGNINLGVTGPIDPAQMVRGGRTAMGIVVYEAWAIPRALDFLRRTHRRYPFHQILSHTFALERINEAFAFASQGTAIRVGIVPH